MFVLSSSIAAEYVFKGITVADGWSSVCPDSFWNLENTDNKWENEERAEQERESGRFRHAHNTASGT